MKRNLLMVLFAMLMGVFCVQAQTNVTINVDNAAYVKVYDGGQYGTLVNLHDGANNVVINSAPLTVEALSGVTATVTCDGNPVSPNYYGFYNMGVSEGSVVNIVTSGAPSSKVGVMFSINEAETAIVTNAGESTKITNYATIQLDPNEAAVISPADGYEISVCSAYPPIEGVTDNGNGTFSFTPAKDGFIMITTKAKGIDFSVDVNVRSNVIINAYDATNQDLGVVNFTNWANPYTATAPMGTQSLVFSAPEGGEIKSIVRVQADGTENNVNYSAGGGWRSMLAAGDKFVVKAVGPAATVKFWGFGPNYSDLDLSNFIIKAGEETLKLEGTQAEAQVHIGDLLTVTTGRGYALKEYTAISGAVQNLISEGTVQTAIVNNTGDIFLYAVVDNSMIINVDNAAAVKVAGANGYGDVLELKDGENKFETVVNPLKITPADKYEILSVTLDGEPVQAQAGSYVVELLSGSMLNITTREIPSAFPVTIMTTGGDIDNLIITKDGEVVNYGPDFVVMVGDEIKISPKLGYMLDSVTDMCGNSAELDEYTDVWTISFTKTASMISVMFKTAPEGKAFVGFGRDSSDVLALLFDKDGNRKSDPASLKAGRTIEVEIGDLVEIQLYGNDRDLATVTVNGTAMEFEAGSKVLDRIAITGNTVIEVTTSEHELLVDVVGDTALETEVGTGIEIGYMYINEVGTSQAYLRPGEKFYVIPTPAKGYKFDGFSYMQPQMTVPQPVDGKYEFTVPEGVEFIFFKGKFVIDNENPAYMVEGNNIYDEGEGHKLMGLTRIADGSQTGAMMVHAFAGETLKLLFWLNIDEFPADEYYCESFCLYNNPEVLISQEYVVNPADVRDHNIISIGAIVKKRGSGVIEAVADGSLVYYAASSTVSSPKAVKVFTISGQLVKELPAGETSIENLPEGVYVLTNGAETVKIVK